MIGILIDNPDNFMTDQANVKATCFTQVVTISKLLKSTDLPYRNLFEHDNILLQQYQSEFSQKKTFYNIKNRIIRDDDSKENLACAIAYHLTIIKMLRDYHPEKRFSDISTPESLNEIYQPSIKAEYISMYRLLYGKYLKKLRTALKNIDPKKN